MEFMGYFTLLLMIAGPLIGAIWGGTPGQTRPISLFVTEQSNPAEPKREHRSLDCSASQARSITDSGED
jgi:hypothetical protein